MHLEDQEKEAKIQVIKRYQGEVSSAMANHNLMRGERGTK